MSACRGSASIESYVHPSMWEDPWAQLRRDAAKKQKQQSKSPEGSVAPGGGLNIGASDSLAAILGSAMSVSFPQPELHAHVCLLYQTSQCTLA